ncbi:MAG: glycoside hydrolase family 9 protein [Limisphaerales bacterium]
MKWFVVVLALAVQQSPCRSETFVRVNQSGYELHDSKIAIAFSSSELPRKFTVERDGQVLFEGVSKPITNANWGKWKHHVELDFSRMAIAGTNMVVRVGETSVPIGIAQAAYAQLPDVLLEFMREQRCGYNPFLKAPCHTNDARTAYGPLPASTLIDATGGWHDAADLLKYLLTSGNATAQMLVAYDLQHKTIKFADYFDAHGDAKPNGVPDILDEARWGLNWMLKLHPAPDQLYHQVADDRDHVGKQRLPNHEIADYGWGPGSNRVVYFADGKPQGLLKYKSESTGIANLAGRYAAAMGLGSIAFKDIDPAFAQKCLKAGLEVYSMGKTKEGVQQGNSYSQPYRYAETTWADDMEWGAAVLYRVSKLKEFLDDAKHYAKLAANDTWMGKEQTGHYQYYPFINLGHFALYDYVDENFQKVLAQYYREGIEQCVQMSQKNPYRVGVPFIWCSNNLLASLVTQCLLYERMTGDTQYHEFMCKNRDWLMGRNPWGTSMFLGIPEAGRYPRDPHLITTKLTGRSVRGGLVDGPVYERIFKTLKGVSVPQPDRDAPFQSELAVYHDTIHDYSSNEPTMDGTASAILMWSLCN